MNSLLNFGFKIMMGLLLIIVISAAIYALIWKLASAMLLLLIMFPFAVAIIWKIKSFKITAPNEKSNNAPYKV